MAEVLKNTGQFSHHIGDNELYGYQWLCQYAISHMVYLQGSTLILSFYFKLTVKEYVAENIQIVQYDAFQIQRAAEQTEREYPSIY